MRYSKSWKHIAVALLVISCFANALAQRNENRPAPVAARIPNPVLNLKGMDQNVKASDGNSYVGLTFGISNYALYPSFFFGRAPELPPCGNNQNASRAWLKIYNAQTNAQVYTFCAIGNSSDLRTFAFNVALSSVPATIYVVIEDRASHKSYQSNCVKTENGGPCDTAKLIGTEVLAAPSVSPVTAFQTIHGRDPNSEEAKFWQTQILKDGLTQDILNMRVLEKLTTNPDVFAIGEMKMIVQRAFQAAGKGSPMQKDFDYWTNRIMARTAYHEIILTSLKKP